ncbi:cell cycle regulator of non-homologous end joining isoform X1 [Marmota flaviventris]|uniref:cell cycle regulator of non-homologous end joining isoform X1 n=1 Tax=Marmota flaviventris TaxID=93162 RepID=UPI003A86F654
MHSGLFQSSLGPKAHICSHPLCVFQGVTLRSQPSPQSQLLIRSWWRVGGPEVSTGLLGGGSHIPASRKFLSSEALLCSSLVGRPGMQPSCCPFLAPVSLETLFPIRDSCLCCRTPAMKTVYCMNEAEMVDVALGILIECRKQEKPQEQSPLVDADKLELSPICSVSPHTSSPGSSSEEEDGGKDKAAWGLRPSQGQGTSSSTSRSPKEAEEEDVLKYVREIFFS